jgi:hypothetical protein
MTVERNFFSSDARERATAKKQSRKKLKIIVQTTSLEKPIISLAVPKKIQEEARV